MNKKSLILWALDWKSIRGGHVFHANYTNSTGIIPNTFLPYTINSWTAGEFRFGLTISRIFNL